MYNHEAREVLQILSDSGQDDQIPWVLEKFKYFLDKKRLQTGLGY
jgi:hypothetical protein